MIRIAILSFAHYHANFWVEAFQSLPEIEVVAIWDDNVVRGREAAGRFKVRFAPDLDAAIDAADAVAICSETINHAPLIERALAAKRAVLCEKPLAANLAEAARIEKAVRAAGMPFMQSFPKRFDPVSHELKRLVDTGELGKIRLVRIRHGHFYGLDPDFRERWYVDPALSGGGALLDEGVHAADLLCWLFGLPAGVTANASSSLGLKVEDQAIAIFDYVGGMLAEVTSSFTFAAADASIEIYGSEGTAIVSGVDLASRDITPSGHLKIFHRTQSERVWNISPIVPRFKLGQFHHQNAIAFADSLQRKVQPPVTLDDGLRSVKLIFRAYEAIRSGVRTQI
ncbi:MAG: Gfo/Idh/MocA family oxidoreductase [Rhodospirillales bacterium]|nr:Gfo/Idh/MocA family oxidoreductase [Rhodospirillales bacterium]